MFNYYQSCVVVQDRWSLCPGSGLSRQVVRVLYTLLGSACPRIKFDSILFVIAQCDLYATESDRPEQKGLEFS